MPPRPLLYLLSHKVIGNFSHISPDCSTTVYFFVLPLSNTCLFHTKPPWALIMTPLRRINLLVLSKVASKFLKQHNFMAFPSPLPHLSSTSSKKQALHMCGHKLAVLLRSQPILHVKSYAKVKSIATFLSKIQKQAHYTCRLVLCDIVGWVLLLP